MTQTHGQDGQATTRGRDGVPTTVDDVLPDSFPDQKDRSLTDGRGLGAPPGLGGLSPRTLGACVFVLVVVTFWQVRRFDYLNWDDPHFVRDNPHVQNGLSVEGLRWAFSAELLFPSENSDYWIPITQLSRMLDVELFGSGPAGPHLMNALIHGVAAALLFTFLWSATGLRVPSVVCAALFAVHPVHVESVAWISERKDVLGGLFWMSGLIAYVHWSRKPGRLRYAAICATFVLGQLSKPIFLVYPWVLLLLDFWPLRRTSFPELLTTDGRRTLAKLLLEKAPLFVLTVPLLLLTMKAAGSSLATLDRLPLASRLAHATVAYGSYLRRIVWPVRFCPLYPPEPVPGMAMIALCGALLIAITVACLWLASRAPYLIVGWGWFLGVLLPLVGLVQVGPQQTADRFLHLPAVGIYIGVVWWGWAAVKRLPHRLRAMVASVAAVSILGGLFVATQRYLSYWVDSVTVWERAIEVSRGNNGLAHCLLAEAFREQGRIGDAIPQFQKAAELLPNRDYVHMLLSDTLVEAGRRADAIAALGRAVRVKPDSVSRHLALGDALLEAGKPEEAIGQYSESLRLDPANLPAHAKMGGAISQQSGVGAAVAYLKEAQAKYGPQTPEISMALGGIALNSGDAERAAACFQQVLAVRPDSPAALANLGDIAVARGQLAEGIEWYRKSLRSQPNRIETHVNLGRALLQIGRPGDALESYAYVVKRRPGWAVARANFGHAFLATGDLQAAVEEYRMALTIDSSLVDVRQDLGAVYARMGALREAREEFMAVVRDAPSVVEAYANLAKISEVEGRRVEALNLWRTALSRRPDWPPAVEALKRLQGGETPD